MFRSVNIASPITITNPSSLRTKSIQTIYSHVPFTLLFWQMPFFMWQWKTSINKVNKTIKYIVMENGASGKVPPSWGNCWMQFQVLYYSYSIRWPENTFTNLDTSNRRKFVGADYRRRGAFSPDHYSLRADKKSLCDLNIFPNKCKSVAF